MRRHTLLVEKPTTSRAVGIQNSSIITNRYTPEKLYKFIYLITQIISLNIIYKYKVNLTCAYVEGGGGGGVCRFLL